MRTYKKKTERGSIPKAIVVSAVKSVVEKGLPLSEVSNLTGIARRSLSRYVKNYTSTTEREDITASNINVGYKLSKQVQK